MVPASLRRRLVARLIDGFVLSAPVTLLVHGISQSVSTTKCVDDGIAFELCAKQASFLSFAWHTWLILFAFTAVYEVAFLAVLGATPGKWVMDMRVVDERTGAAPAPWRLVVRYTVLCLTGSVFTLGWWSPLFDRTGRRRGWHDRAGAAMVVRDAT
ncbi:MAG TPA: RDD family protein [Jatrophihabitantaceae bacterium]|nr:RDD family protein [Jatrophihabitantaceae bacterium]